MAAPAPQRAQRSRLWRKLWAFARQYLPHFLTLSKTAIGLSALGLVALLLGSWIQPATAVAVSLETQAPPCEQPGWFPSNFELKDHTIFWHQGYYYLASIYLYPDNRFAYARSTDLCQWEDLGPILSQRVPGTWDEKTIWAPHVIAENGTYYMYYTGVTADLTQSIMLATSSDPADPDSWTPQGMVFQPSHTAAVWQAGEWADCRDPMVLEYGGVYYLFYAGTDQGGGILGAATGPSPMGPWQDQGPILPADPTGTPESPLVVPFGGDFHLIYNLGYQGARYRRGPSLLGPWGAAFDFKPGWAHEVWQAQDGSWYTSYLTVPQVSISPLTWDTRHAPAWPFIGPDIHHLSLPALRR